MTKYYLFDLTTDESLRELWSPGAPSVLTSRQKMRFKKGMASPLGFWIYSAAEPSLPSHQMFIVHINQTSIVENGKKKGGQTIRLHKKDNGYTKLEVCFDLPDVFVVIDQNKWPDVAESVLLMITQYLRFSILQKQLNLLSQASRKDFYSASMPTFSSLFRLKKYIEHDVTARMIEQDLPFFQAPLNDSSRYLHSELAINIYDSLAEEMDLEAWSERMDCQLETVSNTYNTLTEKIFYYKGMMVEMFLEVAIIILLILGLLYE